MSSIGNVFSHSFNYISTMGISDLLDILIVAWLIFKLSQLIRRTKLGNFAIGIGFFLLVMLLSDLFNLTMINFILRKTVEVGLIALVVLFQPELRRLIERVGSTFRSSSDRSLNATEMEKAITQTVSACGDMSVSRTGALIVFERKVRLNDIIATGTEIDSAVSDELLKNMFFNKAPLHDGAVIIRGGRIAAAGCVLPLTDSQNLAKDLGMRHRAGIGMSEQSDALVIIVSEETGAVSCAIDGALKRHLKSPALEELLRQELVPASGAERRVNLMTKVLRTFFGIELKEAKREVKGRDEKDN